MKTKAFLLLCFFMSLAFYQVSAQNGNGAANKTIVTDWPVPELVVTFDIVCDGVLVDVVTNTDSYFLRCRDHFKGGEFTAWNYHLNNVTFVSEWTGEVFKLEGTERGAYGGMDYTFGNLKGNMGSHYIMNIIADPEDWSLVELSCRCH